MIQGVFGLCLGSLGGRYVQSIRVWFRGCLGAGLRAGVFNGVCEAVQDDPGLTALGFSTCTYNTMSRRFQTVLLI